MPTTETDELLAELADGVLTLTLNRPASGNAFSMPMLEAVAQMVDFAEKSDDVRALVLTGAGKVFSSGGDLQRFLRRESIFGPAEDPALRERTQVAIQRATVVRLYELPKPTIAAVNGAVAGAGLGLALACDLRYAGRSTRFITGFARLGLAGDFGSTWLLRELIGPARAKELLYFSRTVRAEEAVALGLAAEVVEDDVLTDHALAAARSIAAQSPVAMRTIKGNVAFAATHGLTEAADHDAAGHTMLTESPEHAAAVRAFLEAQQKGK